MLRKHFSRFGKVFRCISRFGVSHGSHVEPGLTPKRLMGLDAMNYPNLLKSRTTSEAGGVLARSPRRRVRV